MALRGGSISVGVHTGLATAADFSALASDRQPHFSLAGIDKLLEMLK
jgi:hypothetical protein